MNRYNYYKVHFEDRGGPKWVFIEGPPWGPATGIETWIEDQILMRFPGAKRESVRSLRCSKEEYEKQSLD